jgi:hypothetical protein
MCVAAFLLFQFVASHSSKLGPVLIESAPGRSAPERMALPAPGIETGINNFFVP